LQIPRQRASNCLFLEFQVLNVFSLERSGSQMCRLLTLNFLQPACSSSLPLEMLAPLNVKPIQLGRKHISLAERSSNP
jgi:hypothetical protein